MQESIESHRSAEELESYSLRRLAPSRTGALEQHLLLCQQCRDQLNAVEPYNFVHYSSDGLIYLRITKLRTGEFWAQVWGESLEGGKEFRTKRGAKAYLERTFARMFPEHTCTARCGATTTV
jgi:hypothetical protein